MEFQSVVLKLKLEYDCISKKGIKYDRAILDFGDFKKLIVLNTLESKNLTEILNKKQNNA